MRAGWFVVALTACAPTEDAAAPACTLDDFSTAAIDPQIWGIYEQPPTTIAVRDGALVAALADGAAAYASVYSTHDIDFRGTSVAVEVVQTPSVDGAEVLLQWVVNNRFRHFLSAEAGRLYAGIQNGDDYQMFDTAFDPVAHRHWRLRHDPDRDRVLYEVSPDRVTWTTLHEDATAIPLDQAYVELAGGTYVDVASPGEVIFDNFELAGACP